jgi:hypothetical protein
VGPVNCHDEAEAATPGGGNPSNGVLDYHGAGGRDTEPAGRLQECGGLRLAGKAQPRRHSAVDHHVERTRKPRRAQQYRGLAAGSHQAQRGTTCP